MADAAFGLTVPNYLPFQITLLYLMSDHGQVRGETQSLLFKYGPGISFDGTNLYSYLYHHICSAGYNTCTIWPLHQLQQGSVIKASYYMLIRAIPCFTERPCSSMQGPTLTVLGQLGLGAICHTLNGKAPIITSTLRHVIISSLTLLNFAVCMIKSKSVTVTTVSII